MARHPHNQAKTSLTALEKLAAAYCYEWYGMEQMHIAVLLGVNNVARVNEAIQEIRKALGIETPMRDDPVQRAMGTLQYGNIEQLLPAGDPR